jgi:hypothetical protein
VADEMDKEADDEARLLLWNVDEVKSGSPFLLPPSSFLLKFSLSLAEQVIIFIFETLANIYWNLFNQ